MPIPKSRADLVDSMRTSFAKLCAELDRGEGLLGAHSFGTLHAVDGWSVKDLLAVRLWWTERVVRWIEEGMHGRASPMPAKGYSWRETPRLNDNVVFEASGRGYLEIREALEAAYASAREVVDELEDHELMNPRVFEWAGKYPVARLVSINTTRQYTTARKYVRAALGGAGHRLATRLQPRP